MRILIFGAGAVGQGIGGMLAAHGCRVDLVLRERHRAAIEAGGLHVTGIFGDHFAKPGSMGVSETLERFADITYDFVLVTTKSYDTDTALETLAQHVKTDCVVSVQNGCGNLEKVVTRFGESRALAARVITGFEIARPGKVRITVSADAIHIGGPVEGSQDSRAEELASFINSAGLPCVAARHIRRDLFAKLLYNCALNPLGAILGVHYGALGDNSDARQIMDAVIDEVYSMLLATGERTHWNTPGEYRDFFYGSQIPATYNHRSSMLQDIERGKRTEVDALTGYVSARGSEAGISTPVCNALSSIIRFREQHPSIISPG